MPETAVLVLRVAWWWAVLFLCATLAGRALRSRLRGLAHLAWDGAAGLAVYMGGWLALGQIPGAFRPSVIFAATALLLVAAAGLRWLRPAGDGEKNSWGLPGVPSWPVAALLGAIAIVGLLWSQVPPVFFDTLVYHFAQPDLWLVNGVIAPEEWSLVSWFPPGMSVLYGVGLAWGGNPAAGDANLLMGLLLLAVAADLAGRLWGVRAAVMAPVLLAALPITLHALAIPAADLAFGFFGFATLAAWLLWRRTGEPAWIWRSGLLAAGSVLSKYLGLLLPFGLGILLFLLASADDRREEPSRDRLLRAIWFALPTLVLFLPWLWANALTVGNPVAPVLGGILPTRGLAEGGLEAFYSDALGGLPAMADILQLYPKLLAGDPASAGIYPTPAWGWFPVVLLVAVLVWGRDNRDVRSLLGLAAGGFAIWFLTFRWERFLLAVSALMTVALAGALCRAWERGLLPRIVTCLALALALLGTVRASVTIVRFTGALPVVLGRETPLEFTSRLFPFATVFREAGRRLDPERHRVLLVGETRHHGLAIPHSAPTVFNIHPLAQALEETAGPREATERLRQLGFTHLIVDPGWVQRSGARYPSLRTAVESGRLPIYLKGLGPPVVEHLGVALYALEPSFRAADRGARRW
jgi:hypothetical protein